MGDPVTITKITINEEPYYMKALWVDNVELVLVNRDQYWSGVFTKDKIKYFYTTLQISEERYIKSIKDALSTGTFMENFNVNFSNNKLTLSKRISSSGLKTKYAIIEMVEHSPNGGTQLIADELLKIQNDMKSQIQTKNDELDGIVVQLNQLKTLLQQSIDVKDKMEKDLYARFLSVLNAKKQKISEYEEFIKDLNKNFAHSSTVPAIKPARNNSESDTD